MMTRKQIEECLPSEDEMQFGVEQICELGEQLGHAPIKWGVICAAVANLIEQKTGIIATMDSHPGDDAEFH